MIAPTGMVLVTGAAQRIGRVIALHLAQCGWDIALHYHAAEAEALSLKAGIENLGRRAILFQADLADNRQLEKMISTLPPLSGIIHNACLFERNEKDPDGTRHWSINYAAPLYINAAVRTKQPAEHELCSVFILDNTAMPDFLSHYRASKEALRAALPRLAREAAPKDRINAVALGPTMRGGRESQAHFDRLIEETPLRRATPPEEVAAAIALLLSASSLTGEVLNMDAGLHLGKI